MNRAESCVAVLLQKSTEAKRSYGTLLNATSVFGESNNLFYHSSDHLYKEVLCRAYKEAGVDPAKVAYVEGEGLGIKVTYTVYMFHLCLLTLKIIIFYMRLYMNF